MTDASRRSGANPWSALSAMLVGFFMILVDATIVAVANPTIGTNAQPGSISKKGLSGDPPCDST